MAIPDPSPLHGGLSRRRALAAGAVAVGGLVAAPGPVEAATSKHKHKRHKRKPAPTRPELPSAAPIAARHANPADLGVLEAAALLQAGLLTASELTKACQDRIAARNGSVSFDGSATEINAWVRLYPDLAIASAAAADVELADARRRRKLTRSALAGVPVGLKDLYAVAGRGLTASSHILDGHVAPGDSTVWARLQDAGMVLLGHTHTHEFALGSATPQTGNPWDLGRSVGGSSGGSGAALAARMVPAATGTDTAGSLRIPATACGVTSMKPTYGLVPAHGIIPISWTVDTAGVMARTAGDVALLLGAVAGADPVDASTLGSVGLPSYPTLPTAGAKPLAGVRVGVPNDTAAGTPAAVTGLVSQAVKDLESLGATAVAVDVPPSPSQEEEAATFAAEAITYHGQFYPARSSEYHPATAQELASFAGVAQAQGSTDLVVLQRRRLGVIQSWLSLFAEQRLDAVIKPGANVDGVARNPQTDYLTLPSAEGVTGDHFFANYTGLPVLTTPIGLSPATRMPFGLQVIGAPRTEAMLLRIGIEYQERSPFALAVPPGLA